MDEIDELLNLYELEELFDVLDITPREVITVLINGGHVVLPDFLNRDEYADEGQETSTET